MPRRDGESAILISDDGNKIVCPIVDIMKHQIEKIFVVKADLKKEMEMLQVKNPN